MLSFSRHTWLGIGAGFVLLFLVSIYFSTLQSRVPTPEPPTPQQATSSPTAAAPNVPLFQYVEVVDGCSFNYAGTCVNMRAGPATTFPVVARLRTGIVLKIEKSVISNGQTWYKIAQDPHLVHPERVTGDWYVLADAVQEFNDTGNHLSNAATKPSAKRILVDVSSEMLYAYDGDVLFMQEPISTGLEFTPTPRGTFSVFKMTPSRYMQGPLPGVSAQAYDLPGVPWNLYFTYDGAVIHGAYWHNSFGQPWSHGCVNLSPENAKRLYQWADIGMKVTVQD